MSLFRERREKKKIIPQMKEKNTLYYIYNDS
jgi:hypothetical protein